MKPPVLKKPPLPDLSGQFCQGIHCFAEIKLSDEQFAELKRFSWSRSGKSITCGVELRGSRAWNHFSINLNRPEVGKTHFVFFMHTYTPSKVEKEARPQKFSGILNALDQILGEIALRVSASFLFPTDLFVPAVVFPSAAGLEIPLSSDVPVRITGLGLQLESGPVESLFLDVSSQTHILIAAMWGLTTKINPRLPAYCLEHASSIANKLVAAKR